VEEHPVSLCVFVVAAAPKAEVPQAVGARAHGHALPDGDHRDAEQAARGHAALHVLPRGGRRRRRRARQAAQPGRGQVGAPQLRPLVQRSLRDRQRRPHEPRAGSAAVPHAHLCLMSPFRCDFTLL